MRQFLLKSLWFLLPVLILHLYTWLFYTADKGDLIRLGYIFDIHPSYRNIFKAEFENKIYFTKLSDLPKKRNYDVLTIGDSFTEGDSYGYKNYLGNKGKVDILHVDRRFHNNPIQQLYSMLHGDIFDHYQVKYVILQSIERLFIERIKNIDSNQVFTLKNTRTLVSEKRKDVDFSFKFPSDRILKFPYYSFQYLITGNQNTETQVYRTPISKNLFSVNNSELLFFDEDISCLEMNNDQANISQLNNVLNDLSLKLQRRGITLIVLPSPDKYDMYYDYIIDKNKYPRPLFFEYLETENKNYLYLDSKKILQKDFADRKDIYFYDDTHWSPWATQIIADELSKIISSAH